MARVGGKEHERRDLHLPLPSRPPGSGLLPPGFSVKPQGRGQLAVFLVPCVLTWSEC